MINLLQREMREERETLMHSAELMFQNRDGNKRTARGSEVN